MVETATDLTYIQNTANINQVTLQTQIDNIILRQQELQNYISTLNQGIQQIEHSVQKELQNKNYDKEKLARFRTSISKSIELVADLYRTYQSFEDVKFKYHKQISEMNFKYIGMIEIDIMRINKDDRSKDSNFAMMMSTLMEMFKNKENASESKESMQKDLILDPDYKL